MDILSDPELFAALANIEFANLATSIDRSIAGFGDIVDYSFRLWNPQSSASRLLVKNKLLRELDKEDVDRIVGSNH